MAMWTPSCGRDREDPGSGQVSDCDLRAGKDLFEQVSLPGLQLYESTQHREKVQQLGRPLVWPTLGVEDLRGDPLQGFTDHLVRRYQSAR